MRIQHASARIDGHAVFNATDHHSAFYMAMDAGLVTEQDFLGPRHEEGFTTDAGTFVDRDEAFAIASQQNQIRTKGVGVDETANQERWLEAGNLEVHHAS